MRDLLPLDEFGTCSNRRIVASADNNPQEFVRIHGMREARTATLSFQLNTPLPASPGAAARLTVKTLGRNGATFERHFYASRVERRVRLTAHAFFVSASLVTRSQYTDEVTAGPAGGSVEVSASLTDTQDNPLGDLIPVWCCTPRAVSNTEDRFTGAGTLLQATFTLANLGGAAQLWLFIFDNPSAAAAIAASQQPLVPPPVFSAIDQNANFGGALRPGALFDTGLSWALSTRQDLCQLAPGAVGRFDWLGGQ